ncbi:MAG: ribonuclease E/G [Paracoccaceae bacterium]
MAKKMLIDATHPEETRVVVMDGAKVDEFDFESINKRQLAGNIYLAKVTRVEPSLQAAFVEYGGNRHGFLAFSEIHPDYYQIPIADREAIIAAEAAAEAAEEEDEPREAKKPRSRRAPRSRSRGRKRGDAETRADSETAADTADAPPETDAPKMESAEPTAPEAADISSADKDVTETERHPDGDDSDDGDNNGGDGPLSIAEDAGADEGETVTEDRAPNRRPDEDDSDDDDARAEAAGEVESVGAEKVEDEVRPRRFSPRRYKIQEVVKVRQIMLVQVVKEERGNKGAALTTYLSLAGRYCVLMPNTARGGGISRKITQAADRQKLKEIASELEVPTGMGLIVRTAGARRTKTEIKRDYEFLLRQWDQIRELTLKSIAPALIYEEGSLIKRSIRDLYGRDIDAILVEGEEAYREAKDYMKMLMPSHAKNVQAHREPTPLFSKFQVESHLSAMFNPTVQLKSGGYIVIGVTEALVAIDVNSGRSTREHSIEETALKTNLEASDEVARQLRLRDLAGLIVIDFIDMDENRNNRAVEKRIKDRLKDDRARIQVGRISAFGLMEMSRQRLRPGMIEATTAPCAHCHGTGIVRSADNVALAILREVEEEGVRAKNREIRVLAPVVIANFLINQKRAHVAQIEARYDIELAIEADPSLVSPDYRIDKQKGLRAPRPAEAPKTVSAETAYKALDDEIEEEPEDEPEAEADSRSDAGGGQNRERNAARDTDSDSESKRRRRGKRGGRKRRRSDGDGGGEGGDDQNNENRGETRAERPENPAFGEAIDAASAETTEDNLVATPDETAQKPKRKRPTPRKRPAPDAVAAEAVTDTSESIAEATPKVVEPPVAEAPAAEPAAEEPVAAKKKPRTRKPRAKPTPAETVEAATVEAATAPAEAAPPAETREAAPEPQLAPEGASEDAAPNPAEEPKADKPKRKGWWS